MQFRQGAQTQRRLPLSSLLRCTHEHKPSTLRPLHLLLRLVDCVPGCDPGGVPARICCRRARDAAMSARRSSTRASKSGLPAALLMLPAPPLLLLPFWPLLADDVELSSRCGCCCPEFCSSSTAAACTSSANSRMRRGCSARAMLRSAAASSADSVRCLTATVTKALVKARGSAIGCGSCGLDAAAETATRRVARCCGAAVLLGERFAAMRCCGLARR